MLMALFMVQVLLVLIVVIITHLLIIQTKDLLLMVAKKCDLRLMVIYMLMAM